MRKIIPSLLLCAVAPFSWAQALPQQVSLPQLLEMVKSNNLVLQAERTQVDMAEADVLGAGALPNPTISYGRQRSEREYSIEQALPIFGQRSARISSARYGIEAAQARVRLTLVEALREASHDFISLLIAQEREKYLQDAQIDLDNAANIVNGQVEAGSRSRYDMTRIEIEKATLEAQLAEAKAATANIAAKLSNAVGSPSWRPIAAGSLSLPATALNFEALWPQAQQNLPAVRAALAEKTFADQRIIVARREALPVPSVGVGSVRSESGRENVIGLSVSIPLFDRNRGAINRAEAEARGLQLRSQATIVSAQAELMRATEQFARLQALTERFERNGLEILPRLRQMATDSYRLGRGGILELIDAIESQTEKKVVYLDLLEDALQAEVDVRVASGMMENQIERRHER